jgi:hypothetical protein
MKLWEEVENVSYQPKPKAQIACFLAVSNKMEVMCSCKMTLYSLSECDVNYNYSGTVSTENETNFEVVTAYGIVHDCCSGFQVLVDQNEAERRQGAV